ncbi:hypothetical protein BDV34DRAFT_76269 [Aspergillus parasiticus]|uniref:Uncharacterized protein n=1 Tax=Aspergillus parasiticus TaxID=5067 RepID=A0A5N6DPW7_ASPPA|nr:hypothetical protein BDV34DRAFT_76269 [Aspergillus parasiticus]
MILDRMRAIGSCQLPPRCRGKRRDRRNRPSWRAIHLTRKKQGMSCPHSEFLIDTYIQSLTRCLCSAWHSHTSSFLSLLSFYISIGRSLHRSFLIVFSLLIDRFDYH